MGNRGIVHERALWLLNYACTHCGYLNLSDADMTEAFVKQFPEASKTQTPKMWGYMPTPMLQQAARYAHRRGWFSQRGTTGNTGFRSRGYCSYTVSYII